MRKRPLSLLRLLPLFAAFTLASAGQPALAASWLDKGKELLESVKKEKEEKPAEAPSKEVPSDDGSLPPVDDMDNAFKQALAQATETVVAQLGVTDGFNADPAIRIPLPENMKSVKKALGKMGMESQVEDLEVKLNRAAEAATPKAQALFLQSIKDMSFDDVAQIYKGPSDSATRYFQSKMTPALSAEMKPIVDASLSEVGAIAAYDAVMKEYTQLPFVPDVKANLSEHVIAKGMEGIFHYFAAEEGQIRKDPARWTTDLLESVFGKLK